MVASTHGVFHIRFIAAGLEDFHVEISLAAVAEKPERCAPIAELGWRIAPRATCAHDPQDSLYEQAIISDAAVGSVALPRQSGSIFAHWASVKT